MKVASEEPGVVVGPTRFLFEDQFFLPKELSDGQRQFEKILLKCRVTL